MRVALYARVSTQSQQARGTIGSQLAVLRERVEVEGDEVVAEFCDDGHSGARLDRPGLDALRDAAEAGLIERVWCLSPDRLARIYAYQQLVLDELAHHHVEVRFNDAPPLDDDPQARLLTQVQGVIAEYERAKIAERYRRGKLFRSRAGEVLAWRTPYGYRRQPREADSPAHLTVFEPEAAVVRRIFDDYTRGGHSTREIVRRLAADDVAPPTGRREMWGTSTIGRLLHNEAYIGRVYFNRTESVPDPRPGRRTKQVPRPPQDWIPIAVPAIVSDETFHAVAQVTRDNSKWSPRRTEPGQWLLRGLVKCGVCRVGTNCHTMRGRNGTRHRYYCRNHDLGQGRRPRPALPRTQHPLRRPRRVRPRPGQDRAATPRGAPGRRTSPLRPRTPPTTSCSTPSWAVSNANSPPPTTNVAVWSTSTRPGSSSSPNCNAARTNSPAAARTSPNAARP